MFEYVPFNLFDVFQKIGGIGEDGGRFFMTQFLDVMSYIHNDSGVVHRDLKLENILFDSQLNIKIADFGFATYNDIDMLDDYRGSRSYMAPEIKEYETYDGKKADIFSLGVLLYIIVMGAFPFEEAKKGDFLYNLIINNDHDLFWEHL